MERQFITLFAALFILSCCLFSCGKKAVDNIGEISFDSVQINETAYLLNDSTNPACSLVINMTFPAKSNDEILSDSLTYYIVNLCLGDRYAGLNVREAISQYAKDYINKYREDIEPLYSEELESLSKNDIVGGWYSYYQTIEGNVQYYKKDLLVYKFNNDEYTGGAHGMHTTCYVNIDLKQKRPLTLDDLFTGDYKEAVTDLIWNQLMIDNGVKTHEELEDMGYGSTGEIAPTSNFYLDSNGVTFFYNAYDITPYSMGSVSVNIPFEMLERWLNTSQLINNLKA